ncbi:hypothetical protein GQ600_17404 [Phytophthora cactorum]|nr:hypothetical protein GQ600_17404 [Phytophthora cactorum]
MCHLPVQAAAGEEAGSGSTYQGPAAGSRTPYSAGPKFYQQVILDSAEYLYQPFESLVILEKLEGLFDDEYVASLRSVELAVGELELFPTSRKLNCDIEVIKLNYDCKVISKYTHTIECATQSICVARIGPYFTLKVDGLHTSPLLF